MTVVGSTARVRPGLRVHRTVRIAAQDRTRRHGMAVTSAERTLVDLAAILGPHALRRAIRRAQAMERVSLPRLVQALGRAGRRRGVAALRRIAAEGYVPTRSVLEDAVLDLFDRGGLQRPDVNEPLELSGRRIVPDFRWPAEHLVVEADGAEWHDHELARRDDAERQAILEAHGERVIRVTWQQTMRHPGQTLARVRSAGAPDGSVAAPGVLLVD